ncbi:MAG: hypothetical protein R3F22_00910 [Lysobacteraceae bacterium]
MLKWIVPTTTSIMHRTTAMIGTRDFGSFRFERRNGACALIGPDGLEFSASADAGGRGLAGVDTLGQRALLAPTGAFEHSMSFRFRSRGLSSLQSQACIWRLASPVTGARATRTRTRSTAKWSVAARSSATCRVRRSVARSRRLSNGVIPPPGKQVGEGSGSVVLLYDHWYQDGTHRQPARPNGLPPFHDASELLSAAEDDDAGADVEEGLGGWWITHVFSDKAPTHRLEFQYQRLVV